ncbi:hypothetical protein BX666DRAFT_2030311 [Dichotomocladium elegans]|nr:hypothetical protein BX666DRAFT_2030311 [Dichotomocladium elegans]
MDSSLSIKDSSGRQISLLNDQPPPVKTPMVKRRYHCTEHGCHKSFTTSGHLARHHRIHTGEKNFQCLYPGCPSRFSRQDNMMQHYRTHMSPKSRRHQQHRRAMESASSASTLYYPNHQPYHYGHSTIPTMSSIAGQSVESSSYTHHRLRSSPYYLPSMILPQPRGLMMEPRIRRSSSVSSSSGSSVSSFPSPPTSNTALLPPPHALLGNSNPRDHYFDHRKVSSSAKSISDLIQVVSSFG